MNTKWSKAAVASKVERVFKRQIQKRIHSGQSLDWAAFSGTFRWFRFCEKYGLAQNEQEAYQVQWESQVKEYNMNPHNRVRFRSALNSET